MQPIYNEHYARFQSKHLIENYDEVIRAYTANHADFPPPYDEALRNLREDQFWSTPEGRQQLKAVWGNIAVKVLE